MRLALRSLASLIALCAPLSSVYSYTVIKDLSTLEIKTPWLKERKQLKISLKNGIQALIISDPQLTQSALAVAVKAGSWDDPIEYPGMAHFCEHMLFMGNKKYPAEDEFFRFVGDNGGMANAYTAGDHTVYLFSANNQAFIDGMDRLSQFFIEPLFPESSVKRELLAVDQENDKNIQNDGWRHWMVMKETGNPRHPNAQFSTGTAQTLGVIPLADLKKWFHTHYSADGMMVVAMTHEPLDVAAKAIEEKFASIPKRKGSSYPTETLTSELQRGHLIAIEPYKDLRILNLTWEISDHPSDEHGDQVLAALISSRHEGSLSLELMHEELASSVNCTSEKVGGRNRIFQIEIELTETGVQHVDQVIEKIFQYLALLRQNPVPQSFQKELKAMSLLSYEYQTQVPVFESVSSVIELLLQQPIAYFPDHSCMTHANQQESAKKVLNELKANRCIFFLIAKPELSKISSDRKERWYETPYTIKAIPANQLAALEQIALNDTLRLPEPNPWVPQNFSLVPKSSSSDVSLLIKEPIGVLYHEQDAQFMIPVNAIKLVVHPPRSDAHLEQLAFIDLLAYALSQKDSISIDRAVFAGLVVDIHREGMGLGVVLKGYSDKSKIFWHHIMEELKNLQLTNEEFERFKSDLMLANRNGAQQAPYIQAYQTIRDIVRNDSPLPLDLESALKNLSLQNFNQLHTAFFERCYLEMFCFGNLTAQDSVDFFETVTNVWACQPILPENISRSVGLNLKSCGPFRLEQTINQYGNAALLCLQSPTRGLKGKPAVLVLEKILKTAFFDTLRTKQQTGYITQMRAVEAIDALNLFFLVQSTTYEANELIARFDLFLEDFLGRFSEEVPLERFNQIKAAVIQELSKPMETMSYYLGQRFHEAFDLEGRFNEAAYLIHCLQRLSYEEFKAAAVKIIHRENQQRIALCMNGEVKRTKSLRYMTVSKDEILKASDSALR